MKICLFGTRPGDHGHGSEVLDPYRGFAGRIPLSVALDGG